MMEVTPHLKSVLKNYQHSATKSLQGPGGLTLVAEAAASPDLKEDEFLQPVPFPIQQLPILTAADTSCSERTETILEGETISCFVVGGEKRLCLPQILNSVLREFSLMQINQECDRLQIYCSRCTPEQLNVLKNQGILPAAAPSCGLITKTDAERLCSALLHPQTTVAIAPRKGSLTFHIYHRCFGKCRGLCTPEMYTTKGARCVECLECHGAFSPQQFVCHVHGDTENRTVHWGFDSKNWRAYVQVCRDQLDWELYGKYLDEMGEMYDGKLAFATPPPPPPVAPSVENSLKRKQVPLDLDMKQPPHQQTDLPHSKRPRPGAGFDEYFGRFPYNLHQVQQIYAALDPLYVQCVHSMAAVAAAANHHRPSAFKPVPQCLEKTRGKAQLNNPDVCFQPNVALAAAPRKARWLNAVEEGVKSERTEEDVAVVDSTVSVVQSTGNIARYNSEIELSTDTEDSASEASSDHYVQKLEDLLKTVDCDTRQSVLAIFRRTAKEHEALLLESRSKDSRIAELESKLSEIESELSSLRRETTVNGCREESPETPKTATSGEEDERLAGNDGGEEKKDETKPAVVVNGSGSNCNSGSGSSIIVKSVIASIETNKAIIVQGGE